MIPASLVLILVAVVLLGSGLARGTDLYLVGSIAASLLAAIALILRTRWDARGRVDGPEIAVARPVGGRYRPRDDQDDDDFDDLRGTHDARDDDMAHELLDDSRVASGVRDDPRMLDDDVVEGAVVDDDALDIQTAPATIPAQGGVVDSAGDGYDDEDPPDEPRPETVNASDAMRIARMTTDVFVIDGRPRYHVPGCGHLLGRESEALPVNEAVELGFTPCGMCEPNSHLLAAARRV